MNKNYLKYLFKSNKALALFVVISEIAIFGVTYTSTYQSYLFDSYITAGDTLLVIMIGLSLFLPILLFSFVFNKKAVDSYFALPVKRMEILVSNFIFMIIVVYLPYLLCVLITGMFEGINMLYLLYLLLAVLLSGIIMLIFNTGVLLISNSLVDGVIISFAYLAIPLLLELIISVINNHIVYGFYLQSFSLFDKISFIAASGNLVGYINGLIAPREYIINELHMLSYIASALISLAIGLVSIKVNFLERKVERAETISDNFFSYPLIIHLYAALLIFAIAFSENRSPNIYEMFKDSSIFFILVWIAYISATFIYRRKLEIKKGSIVFLLIATLISVVAFEVAYKTEGFGLSYKYNKDYDNAYYHYYNYNYDNFADFNLKAVDDYSTLYVEFEVDVIPSNPKYKEINDYFNNVRNKSISDYFDGKNDGYGQLAVVNNFDEKKYDYMRYQNGEHYYYHNVKLSMDELKYINDNFCEVRVSMDTFNKVTEGYDFVEYKLSDLLSK